MARKKQHGFNGSRLKSKMQATIAFACYNKDIVLTDWKGMNINSQNK